MVFVYFLNMLCDNNSMKKVLFILGIISFFVISCSPNTSSSKVSFSFPTSESSSSRPSSSIISSQSSIVRSSTTPTDPTFTDYDNGKIIKGFCSKTIGNEISFKFYVSKYFPSYLFTILKIESENYCKSVYLPKDIQEYTFNEGFSGQVYKFIFTPYYDEKSKGPEYVCTRMIPSDEFSSSLPMVYLNSDFGMWPDTDYVTAPTGCWGSSIINNDYVNTNIQITSKDGEIIKDYSGARFKIRGNTSAYAERKGYKIKLESKDDMLKGILPGNRSNKKYADKEWQLLNKARSIKQTVGFEVMRELGATYVPDSAYVNLFINGDYRGVYLLMDTVKDGNGSGDQQSRVPINNDGFLIEDDAYWWNEPLYFETPLTKNSPMHFTFKYPDAKDISTASEKYTYIKKYFTDFENSLLSSSQLDYLSYINQKSFVIWILGQDIMCNEDGGGANIFIYKKDSSTSPLCMGPGWDYDATLTNVQGLSHSRYNPYFIYPSILKKSSFVNAYNELFKQKKDSLVTNVMERVFEKTIDNQLSYSWDDIRFGSGESLKSQIVNITTYLSSHIKWMSSLNN